MRKVRYETNNYLEKVHSCDSEDAVIFKIIRTFMWRSQMCAGVYCVVTGRLDWPYNVPWM